MNSSSESSPSPITVRSIFVGNSLAGDDGVAIHLLERIRAAGIPPGIELIEGATAGIALIEDLLDVPRVIIVDAVASSGQAGQILCLDSSELTSPGSMVSCHDLGVEATVELARKAYPDRFFAKVTILGVSAQIAQFFSTELSDPVAAALPELERRWWELIQPICD